MAFQCIFGKLASDTEMTNFQNERSFKMTQEFSPLFEDNSQFFTGKRRRRKLSRPAI
jgi:hypothetical protein